MVELSADEAEAANAEHVTFDKPVSVYFENFDGRDVGKVFTNGALIEEQGRFVQETPGVVLEIVGEPGGAAEIDTTGDGVAESGSFLVSTYGITVEEREELSVLYGTGQELARVQTSHFSGICGGHAAPIFPPGTKDPNQPPPNPAPPNPCPTKPGSTIRLEGQCLGESVPLVGSPFRLHYESERTPAAEDRRTIEIPVTGATLPTPLQEVQVEVQVAGRRWIASSFAPTANDRRVFDSWDGIDAYGRPLQGAQPVTVVIRYGYTITFDGGNTGRGYKTQTWRGMIGPFDARGVGLGGWTLSSHHTYDPNGRVLYRGEGTTVRAEEIPPVITTVAGGGSGTLQSGQPATSRDLQQIQAVAIDAGGAIYGGGGITVSAPRVVYRIDPDTGILTFVAGGGSSSVDGVPATNLSLQDVRALAVGPDGSLYISNGQSGAVRVWRVTPDGIAHHFAGTGVAGYSGDGGLATSAQISAVAGMDVAPDGTVYLADINNARIRKVTPDGTIRHVAGNGMASLASSLPTAAATANISQPADVAVGADGTLYFSSSNVTRVLKITPDGKLDNFAGGGALGDGNAATSATIGQPRGLVVGADGSVYFATQSNHRIRRVGPDGLIQTVAGIGGPGGFNGDARAARGASINTPNGIAMDGEGNLYIADLNNKRIRKVVPPLAGFSVGEILVPSRDGSELYLFDEAGRHQKTIEPRTRKDLLTFDYTEGGKLASVTDANGNVHTIVRDGEDPPTAIGAPFGQETELTIDDAGFLRRIENPAGEAYELTYSPDGLLETLETPRNHAYTFEYDDLGRLQSDEDPEERAKTLARTATDTSVEVTLTTELLRETTARRERTAIGDKVRTSIDPAGLATVRTDRLDGTRKLALPSGVTVDLTEAPDPRLGLAAPLPAGLTVTLAETQPTSPPAKRSFVATLMRSTPTVVSGETTLQEDEWTIESATTPRVFRSVYEKKVESGQTVRKVTTTTPESREIVDYLDDQGRLLSRRIGTLEPARFGYDARGRLETIAQGAGGSERVTTLSYSGTTGFLANLEDPLLRDHQIDSYDAAGRPTQETLPGGRVVGFDWDANGNLVELTPPGQPAHAFAYDATDLETSYTPPEVVPSEPWPTTTTWDGDRQVDTVSRPDGTEIELDYDTAGRLETIGIAEGDVVLHYDGPDGGIATGQLEEVEARAAWMSRSTGTASCSRARRGRARSRAR